MERVGRGRMDVEFSGKWGFKGALSLGSGGLGSQELGALLGLRGWGPASQRRRNLPRSELAPPPRPGLEPLAAARPAGWLLPPPPRRRQGPSQVAKSRPA